MPLDVKDSSLWNKWAVVRKRRKLIFLSTLTCAISAGVFSLSQPKIYNATAYLMIAESKIADTDLRTPNFIYFELLRSYETLINSDYLIQKTVENFHLDKLPYQMSVEQFKQDRILQVELSKNTRLLEVSVDFPNARLATDIANYFAQNAENFIDQMNLKDAQKTRGFLKQLLDQASRQLETVSQRLLEFNRSAGLESVRESVWNLLEVKSKNESEISELSVKLSIASARLDSLEELKRHKPTIALNREWDENKISEEGLPSKSIDRPRNPANSQVREEFVNPVYQQVQDSLVDTNLEIQALKAGLQAREKGLVSNRQKLTQLLREKATKEMTLDQLSEDHQTAQKNYATWSNKYQEASLMVSARSTDLKVMAPAIVPEKPIKPRILLNILIAGGLGLMVSILLALLSHNLGLPKAQNQIEVETIREEKIKEIRKSAGGF